MFPEFTAFPYGFGVLGVLLDDGQDGSGYDAMGAGEVVVDFWILLVVFTLIVGRVSTYLGGLK